MAERGRFIVIDGPDGAGKTTQLRLLAEALVARGICVKNVREPGGTAAGEAIRSLVLEQRKAALSPLAETFLFQAARAQLVEEVIAPALAEGTWILCDRFSLSTLVYQGYAGGVNVDVVRQLSGIASAGLQPDPYLVLWVPLEVGVQRREQRAADRMESKGEAFLRRVAESFREEVEKHPGKYTLLDGVGTTEEVAQRIWARIDPLIGAR